ncbi:hypothetical protein A2V71_04365 [Candidatus Berkelbacteria bacterium RBG_13_40_8]|uniref:Uncharacterized protein n=1 Tax=Candidatus Berkelbacteria bacterium RBG_13_40_8 TaxID=1797467 RepID=A0A1F5DNP2_9BACT|nr:MAG: hypothetical protein A2V71_04365 [Candidatus Berkelbacteria bacterium RBG_13_40_8]
MKKDNFTDGVCDNCGNTGLAGEKCSFCGGILSKIEGFQSADDVDSIKPPDAEEPEVYPLEELEKEEKIDDQIL